MKIWNKDILIWFMCGYKGGGVRGGGELLFWKLKFCIKFLENRFRIFNYIFGK